MLVEAMEAASLTPLFLHSELRRDCRSIPAVVLGWVAVVFLGFNAIWSHLSGGAIERTFGSNLGLHLCSVIYSQAFTMCQVLFYVL